MDLTGQRDPAPRRQMRADAVRNRQSILDAAGLILMERGPAADVREIARTAGVGMGTLYRHFATKDELLGTVVEHRFREWAADIARTAEAEPDAWRALVDTITVMAAAQRSHRAMTAGVLGHPASPRPATCDELLHPLLEGLLGRCDRAGVLREGVTLTDLGLILVAVDHTADVDDQGWQRHLAIALDGLRSCHDGPLGQHSH